MNELLRAIRNDVLPESELVRALPKLVASFESSGRSDILEAVVLANKRNKVALDPVFPRFASIVRTSTNEGRVCDVLDVVLAIDEVPAILRDAANQRFTQVGPDDDFVTPRAAAVLLKFGDEKQLARAWLERNLSNDQEHIRVAAAIGLHSAGISARESVPALAKLLRDESGSVRVASAIALLDIIDGGSRLIDEVISTLIRALGEADAAFTVRPLAFSEWQPSHRYYAVSALGSVKVRRAEVAEAVSLILRDDDEILRLTALKSLARLGERSASVTEAVRKAAADMNASIAAEAAVTLRKLAD